MSKKKLISALAAGVVTLTLTAAPALGTDGSSAERKDRVKCETNRRNTLDVFGLTADQKLICFSERNPGRAQTVGAIAGLDQDIRLVGIDFRPANGVLYGLGDKGGVYTIDQRSAAATLRSRLNRALEGASFGVDFNPTVDRLRIISDTGQNLRANVDDGTTTPDTALNYVGPPAVNPAPGVTAAAYTNNDADPNTATTLYDIDSAMDQVVIQAPPNLGPLSATGKLGVDTDANVSFDIYSTVRDGTTVDVRGLASLTTSYGSSLYQITLFTGRARLVGNFPTAVVGIAIPLNQL